MAKREFNTEADIRNYQSKVLMLPKKLLMQLNLAIDGGAREWRLERIIKENYKGTISCPTPPTLNCYIRWYEARKRLAIATGTLTEPTRTEIAILEKSELEEISSGHTAILDGDVDITNKKELLERLIKKCIQRIKHLEALQETEGSTAGLESVLGNYLREMHSLVQTQLKLSGELQEESNEYITKLLNENIYKVVQIFFTSINQIVPEKADALKKDILNKLSEQSLMANSV